MLRMIWRAFLAVLAASAMFSNQPAPVSSYMIDCPGRICKEGYVLQSRTLRNYELLKKQLEPDMARNIEQHEFRCINKRTHETHDPIIVQKCMLL